MAEIEKHEVVQYKGRDICSCGDFNCASLDTRGRPFDGIYIESPERQAVKAAYKKSRRWITKVNKMDDDQVIAVYLRLKAQNLI